MSSFMAAQAHQQQRAVLPGARQLSAHGDVPPEHNGMSMHPSMSTTSASMHASMSMHHGGMGSHHSLMHGHCGMPTNRVIPGHASMPGHSNIPCHGALVSPFHTMPGHSGVPVPLAPKRPMSAYYIFTNQMRPKLMQELGMTAPRAAQMTKLIAEKWNALSAEEKEPYESQALAQKAQYEQEFAMFKGAGGLIGGLKRKGSKRARVVDPTKPKRPMSGYFIFVQETRQQLQEELGQNAPKAGPLTKMIAAKWNALSIDEKKPWEEKSLELRLKYEKEMDEWRDNAGKRARQHTEGPDVNTAGVLQGAQVPMRMC